MIGFVLLPPHLRQRDQDAIDAELISEPLEVRRVAEHRHSTHRSTLERRCVVHEANDLHVTPGLGMSELVGQGRPRRLRTDDQCPHGPAVSASLSLESEHTGLEANSAAAEKDQQRRDRWSGEHRQLDAHDVRDHHERHGG